MSFQHFRLGELAMSQPLPAHLTGHQAVMPNINVVPNSVQQFPGQAENTGPSNTSFVTNTASPKGTKQPYGSGDTDDGYTLLFPNIAAFNEWRAKEEETNMVEFVKGDTHGSKAVPPRFKDHTKLVCARHSRSGRKKYVKKHPERVRKVPSRKLEGQGCPASISYKTYFDTEEVRACYNAQHSHEIGPANLPFTRRGRKAAVQQEKERGRKSIKRAEETSSPSISSTAGPSVVVPNVPRQAQPQTPTPVHRQVAQQQPQPIQQTIQQPVQQVHVPTPNQFSTAVSMIAPLPQMGYQPIAYGYGPPPGYPGSNERWDRMETLFASIREHSRTFEYPAASVAALESVLVRLYLESPVVSSMPQQIPSQAAGRPGEADASGSDESS